MSHVPFQEGAFQNSVFQTLDDTAVVAPFQSNAFFGIAFENVDNTPLFNDFQNNVFAGLIGNIDITERCDAFQNNAFQNNAFQLLVKGGTPPPSGEVSSIGGATLQNTFPIATLNSIYQIHKRLV